MKRWRRERDEGEIKEEKANKKRRRERIEEGRRKEKLIECESFMESNTPYEY